MKTLKMTRKGFTLVELIVVITILAILGTIAFLSFQGYSAQARDSKRTSDARSLISTIAIKSTEGIGLISLVDTTGTAVQHANTVYVAGTTVNPGTDYAAGKPNYTALGINSANFKDPNGPDYALGATTDGGGAYQVAAKLEKDGVPTAMVQGNFTARTNTAIASTLTNLAIGTYTTFTIADANAGKIKKGDTVTFGGTAVTASTTTVSKVSADGKTITTNAGFTTTNATNAPTIALAQNDVLGLIKDKSTANPVTDTSVSYFPY